LSNTEELTKYFLFGFYKKELNFKNPLGLGGKLATAYASLIRTLWQDKTKVATPKDLKKTLGKRVEKFSGFGQQDSAELTFWLLDLLHEDCNRVKDKPYKVIDEMFDATDE
jgi:ubiquitin carboxyl-terminal hydrolase 4/11/15